MWFRNTLKWRGVFSSNRVTLFHDPPLEKQPSESSRIIHLLGLPIKIQLPWVTWKVLTGIALVIR